MPITKELAIRLMRQGCTNRPFFKIVVIKKHKGPQKGYKEQLGTFDPMPNKFGEKLCAINFDRLKHWMSRGALPTKPVEQLLGLSGFFPLHPMTYVTAKRNRKKLAEEAEKQTDSEGSEIEKVAMTYDWNAPAQIVSSEDQVAGHGDLVVPSEYRHSETTIAIWNPETGNYSFVSNPDDSASGYLTIPAKVLEHVTDAVQKYDVLIQKGECFNMHVSNRDRLVVEQFGENASNSEFRFDLWFQHGEKEEWFVTPPGAAMGLSVSLTDTWSDVLHKVGPMGGEEKKFNVKVSLQGDLLQQYKDKFTVGGKKYSWMRNTPELGAGWKLEKGQQSSGQDHYNFVWKFQGPLSTEDDTKQRVATFLSGFDFTFE